MPNANVKNSHNMPGVEATFTLQIIPEHEIQVGGGVLISYPPQITPSPTEDIKVVVDISNMAVDNSKVYSVPDKSARAIFISNVI